MKLASLVVLLMLALAGLTPCADVSGSWTFEVVFEGGAGTPSFVLEQKGEKLTGKYKGQLGEADVTGTVKGDSIVITFSVSGTKVEYTGTIESATSMKGKVNFGDLGSGTWTGKKN